ncbi:hypothetical protein FS749_011272 [Ceratobasidium sp. UAMH 11750]|nr:hypothetical protein FS749_011272 [Ceratobasidium sp. UAMH 11750]
MPPSTTLPFSDFTALPYYVQEHIMDLIDHYETYLALVVTCKYLSELCARSLYQTLEFSAFDIGKKRWPKLQPSAQFNNVRLLQCVYTQTLIAKPELAAFTQRLTWDISDERHLGPTATALSVDQVWSTFEQLAAVRTLDLRVHVASYTSRPPVPLFPNLVKVRVEGVFPQNALEQILFTSPYIRHLAIAPDTSEYLHLPGRPHAYGAGIEHFLRACVSKQAFRALRTLDIGLESGVNPKLASQFIEMSAGWIEELRIEYNFGEPLTAFENWVVPMLKSGRWRRLRKLELPRLVVPQDPESDIKAYCPALVCVTHE